VWLLIVSLGRALERADSARSRDYQMIVWSTSAYSFAVEIVSGYELRLLPPRPPARLPLGFLLLANPPAVALPRDD
jgi:hypothetical protein